MSEPRPESQPAQQQTPPGTLGEMTPKPDHGEESYRGSGRLTGKAAVITGGDSGIGRAVAIAFAREGADVLIHYLNEHEDAKDTAKYVEEAGRKCVLVAGDLADRAHAKTIIPKAVEEFGKVDILVNNAAFQMSHDSLEEVSDDEWDYTLAVNLSAMFTLCKDALPHMRPGATLLARMPLSAYICAMLAVKLAMPALVMAYGARLGLGMSEFTDEELMIEPPDGMCGITSLHSVNIAERFTARVWSHSSSETSSSVSWVIWKAALLTRMSTLPNASTAFGMIVLACARSARSPATSTHFRPASST